ncbi:MAG TPA: aminopeptidase P family protein [Hydrogenispora sp.]|jgi:Xaa-Pro aminopeptidase|nr:aminopeptidase P family protein [Hydrogenispora sp.]
MERLTQFRQLLSEGKFDGFVVTAPASRRYLSGFTGSSGVLVINREEAILLTDFRYLDQAAEEVKDSGFQVKEHKPQVWETVAAEIMRICSGGRSRWGFESEHLVEKNYRALYERMECCVLTPTEGFVNRLRRKKSAAEIAAIRKAVQITDQAWARLLPELKPGRTEKEIAALFEYFQRDLGAEGTSFPTIVASGPRSALPHGVPTEKKLEAGELLVLDGGARYDGYCSDFTRTIVVGAAPTAQQQELYDLVLRAQETALAGMRAGMTGKEVDALARGVIAAAGYGERFGHGLGHSLGLQIHEPPRLSLTDETVLEPGVVCTVEPGIYLTDWGGIRIEDVVVITEDGIENLTNSPKTLTI